MKKNILVFLCLSFCIFLYTFGFWHTFFQQDEWNGFGTVIYLNHRSFLSWFGILGSYHFIPFSQLFYLLLYRMFGYHVEYFALTSLTLHTVASFLVYVLIRKITNNGILGFIGAILFTLNFNTSQAYLHLGVFPATVTCFIIIMLFMLYIAYLPRKHIFSLKDGTILSVLFFIAVGLREDGLLLIPLFPLWMILFRKNDIRGKNKNFFLFFGCIVILFFLFRFSLQIFTPHDISVTKDSYWLTFLINLFWFLPKIFAQTIVSANDLLVFVWNTSGQFAGVPLDLNVALKIFFPIAIICIDIVLTLFLCIGFWLSKNIEKRIIIFGVVWMATYSILLSAVGRQMDIVEPRYLYFPSFGIVLSLITAAYSIQITIMEKYKKVRKILFLLFFLAIVVFLTFSYQGIRQTISTDITQGNARKSILTSLTHLYPQLPKRTVIYIRCKNICHRSTEFGLPNTAVLPFSSGPGYIFLLQYAKDNEQAYFPFFKKQSNGIEFLWDYGAEGYKNIGLYGFGYFTHEDQLKKAVIQYHIEPQSIIGLEYNEDTYILKDISSQVKKEISLF